MNLAFQFFLVVWCYSYEHYTSASKERKELKFLLCDL